MAIKVLFVGLITLVTLSIAMVTPGFAGGAPIELLETCPYAPLGKAQHLANKKCTARVTVYSDYGSTTPCQNCPVQIFWQESKRGYIKQSSDVTDQDGIVYVTYTSHTTGERILIVSATLSDGRVVSTEYPMIFLKKSEIK